MNPMLAEFVAESRDLLDKASGALLTLEREPGDAELINRVFRAFHTIKGASGLFDFVPLTKTVHAAEDLLDCVRESALKLEAPHVDRLLETVDQLNRWMEEIEASEALGVDAEQVGAQLETVIRGFLPSRAAGVASVAPVEGPGHDPELQAWLDGRPSDLLLTVRGRAPDVATIVRYRPDARCFFAGEDPFLLARETPELVHVELALTDADAALSDLDPFECALELWVVSAAPKIQILDHFAYVEDQCRVGTVQTSKPTTERPVPVSEELDLASAAGVLLARQVVHLDRSPEGRDEYGVAQVVTRTFQSLGAVALASSVPEVMDACLRQQSTGPLRALIQAAAQEGFVRIPPADASRSAAIAELAGTQLMVLETVDRSVEVGTLLAVQRTLYRSVLAIAHLDLAASPAFSAEPKVGDLIALARVLRARLGAATSGANPGIDEVAGPGAEADGASQLVAEAAVLQKAKTIKVDLDKIEELLDLAGELTVAKNALPFLARRAAQGVSGAAMSKQIKQQYDVLNRITDNLQNAVMSIRMLEVGHILQRFPRLVRDLARKQSKQIRLVVEGEDTEADKDIIQLLPEALVHVVRNAIDHGIESPAERARVGKPVEAEIRISAAPSRDRVMIEISDDGRGIDAHQVREKAVAKGLLSRDRADALTEEQAIGLVFAPGFSTATQVSELSGRGVGMDVVRSTVESCGGAVSVSSRVGQGTTVRLSLPLTTAVSRILIVEARNQTFGVQMDAVERSLTIRRDRVRRINGQMAMDYDGGVMRVVQLGDELGLPGTDRAGAEAEEVYLMVYRMGTDRIGVIVDGFHETLDVIIKPMLGVMADYPAFTGTALLGDGRVLIILNLKEVVGCR